jgi:hypothetical protein
MWPIKGKVRPAMGPGAKTNTTWTKAVTVIVIIQHRKPLVPASTDKLMKGEV